MGEYLAPDQGSPRKWSKASKKVDQPTNENIVREMVGCNKTHHQN